MSASDLKFSFCNELLANEGYSLADQSRIVADLGYMGLEIAPHTLKPYPHMITKHEALQARDTAYQFGIQITGLHWLLWPYPNLSISNSQYQLETQHVLMHLVKVCHWLGGKVVVHGSPKQRSRQKDTSYSAQCKSLKTFFAPIIDLAAELDITYCIEPLSRHETDLVNTLIEAVELVDIIDQPAFKTMIDTSAAGLTETQSVAELFEQWLPSDYVHHIQMNDTNRGAPGTGQDPFEDMIQTIQTLGWTKPIAIEPFWVQKSAHRTAKIPIETLTQRIQSQ